MKDDLYQKTRGNMIFSVYIIGVTGVTLPSWQKNKDAQKNTPKGDISGITEKDDIHPRKYGISAEIPH